MTNALETAYEVETQIEVIYEALDTIKSLLREHPGALARAEGYWLAHIDGALLNRGGILGGSFINAAETLQELQGNEEGC